MSNCRASESRNVAIVRKARTTGNEDDLSECRSRAGNEEPPYVGASSPRGRNESRISRVSVAVGPSQPIGVKVRIAEQFLAYADPLHEQADVEFVGHPDTAMHLHGFIHGERGAK